MKTIPGYSSSTGGLVLKAPLYLTSRFCNLHQFLLIVILEAFILKGAVMRTPNRIFLGKDDPSRITLEQVFPVGDIVFSTPFVNEPVKYQRVLVEGSCGYLEYFDTFARSLLERETDHLGRWTGMDQYHSDSDMVLIYEPTCSQQMRSVRLLIFVLRADLIQACHLKLSPSSLVIGTFNQVEFLHKQVPLPDGIGNGYIDMAPLIIVPTKNKRGWII